MYFRTMWRLKRWDSGVVVGNSPAARAGEIGRMVVWRLWLLFRLSFEEALGHAAGPVPVGIFLENLLNFSLNLFFNSGPATNSLFRFFYDFGLSKFLDIVLEDSQARCRSDFLRKILEPSANYPSIFLCPGLLPPPRNP